MSLDVDKRRSSLPVVPASFLILIALCAGIWWWMKPDGPGSSSPPHGPLGSGIMEPFRTPGGTLQTNGITKTEEIRKDKNTGSWWGTTSAGIRFNATYRYEVELRSDWKLHIDEQRRLAFVVAPAFKPQLPVAVDSQSVQEWTSSGWARFDKWDHLQKLRQEISPVLEEKAKSHGYMDLARGDARSTVEEFVSDWIVKNRPWPEGPEPVIKVYFSDEKEIPFPDGRSLEDFLP